MSTTPIPTPEKQSNLLWWVLGLLGAAVVVLGLAGLLAARFLLQDVQVHRSGEQVEIRTPVGDLKVSKDATPGSGLPVYPGATLFEPAATVELVPHQDEAVEITAARYRTSDSLDRVDAWYREQLGPEFQREGAGVMVRKKDLFGVEVKSDDIAFVSETNDLLRIVVLQKKMAAVEIALVRIGKQEAQ